MLPSELPALYSFHIFTVLSSEAEANLSPDLLNAIDQTVFSCDVRVAQTMKPSLYYACIYLEGAIIISTVLT